VVLSSEQEAMAEEIGRKRTVLARLQDRKHTNNPNGDYIPWLNEETDMAAARCEMAGKVYTRMKWVGYTEGRVRGTADLGTFIDVKRITGKTHRLLLKPKQLKPDFAYLLVLDRKPFYHLLGWMWGREATMAHWDEPHPGRGCFMVPQKFLNPCVEELLTIAVNRGEAPRMGG
jgi:hypothetical protein